MTKVPSTNFAVLLSLTWTAVNAFSPSVNAGSKFPTEKCHFFRQNSVTTSNSKTTTALNLFLPDEATNLLLSTIDSDIASIPDDQFGKVFAGGGLIMLGSILSTVFVGFLLESNGGGYADLVAETYAEQNYGEDGDDGSGSGGGFLDSLGLSKEEKVETEEMVRAFREKKMKKAGTWTEEDEKEKVQKLEQKDMFSDYD
mmetsp:Transcript_26642/g.55211  ORF Transcript_26642/g.55211 Transcript_26642/m.55211 type:complete len:199 (+) Transcript_26642:48-644(+)